jgi:hypothetical protein
MRQRVVRGPKLLIAGLVVGSVLVAHAGAAEGAPAYDRIAVPAAGISLVVPQAWFRTARTRDEAVGSLNTGFRSGHDANGDHYDDHSVGVQVYRNAHTVGSLQDLRSSFARVPFHDVTVKRTRVAQRPAFVATYVQDFGNVSISPVFATMYVFVSRSHQVGLTFQTQQRSDDEFDKMTRTMVRSIRVVR